MRRLCRHNLLIFSGGDGEIRTLVQTRNEHAFYMLIFKLVVVCGQV